MNIIVENQTSEPIEIKDLGITLAANEMRDITSRGIDNIHNSDDLLAVLGSDTLRLVQNSHTVPKTYYTVGQAMRMVAGYNLASQPVELPGVQKENENKIYVHNTYRPVIDGKSFLTTWAGRDDDSDGNIGEGTSFNLVTSPNSSESSVDVDFAPERGNVYIHHAYFGYDGAGLGDCIKSGVFAHPCPLIETQGDYNIENNKVIYVGTNSGTHQLAGIPNLVPAFGKGNWDYIDGALIPNFEEQGSYDIYDIEKEVYRIVNNFQIYGTVHYPIKLDSYDTKIIRPGYFIRVTAVNNSSTSWKFWFNMAMFREQTI